MADLYGQFSAVYSELCRRSMQDPEFRALAISDPHAAWKTVSGVDLPEGLKLNFVEPHEGASFSLPIPGSAEGELDDAALAGIAGGKGSTHNTTHTPSCGGTVTCKTTSSGQHAGTAHGGHVHIHV